MVSLKHFKKILTFGRNEIGLIIIYSAIVGFFSLIIPVAAQGLVTFVSFGRITQPLFILGVAVFIALSCAAFFRILQIILVENIQQRIFAHTSLDFADTLPKLNMAIFERYRSTELTNRYFDIFTIQKALATLFISGAGVFLQALLGMLLLATYHPLLLTFDIVLIFFLVLVIWLPWRQALKTALKESSAKYEVAGWLEELARLPLLFKFNHYARYGYEIADDKVATYLTARQSHFSRLLQHIIGTHVIQILASTILLVLGGFLVIKNQLTLGQLVAAEIVVTALGESAAKFSTYLENIYDLLAAADKVDFLLDLPLEPNLSAQLKKQQVPVALDKAPAIVVKNLTFTQATGATVLSDLSWEVGAKEQLVIYGESGSGKTLLTKLLIGLCSASSGKIFYNSIPLQEYPLDNLRCKMSYINGIELYDGSLFDNLVMHQAITLAQVREVLNDFQLGEKIAHLPEGLYTQLSENQHQLSSHELQMLMFVRAALAKPYVMIIDEVLDRLPNDYLTLLLSLFQFSFNESTLIVTTRRADIAAHFINKVIL